MKNNLYPLKFQPIYKSKIWGGNRIADLPGRVNTPDHCGESWDVCGIEGCESVVINGFLEGNSLPELIEVYMGDLVGESVYDKYGLDFPLLVKIIDAQDDLSIQVHPDNELAAERHNSFGKSEMWYVLDSEPGARLINGFASDVSKSEYQEKVEENRVSEILNSMEVEEGDVFYIPAGRVHAIGKGCMVVEIQQSSDITYRIYDYGRRDSQGNLRELHTALAVDAISYGYATDSRIKCSPEPNATATVVSCDYFTTNIFRLSEPVEKDFPDIDSFIIYICVEGSCTIEYDEGDPISIAKGESVLVPACISSLCFVPEGDTKLLEVYIKGE